MTLKPSYMLRVSGIRIAPENHAVEFPALVQQALDNYSEILEAAIAEPYFLDDCQPKDSLWNLVADVLFRGEILIYMHEGNPVAFHALENIIPGRSAEWLGYAIPEIRGTEIRRVAASHLVAYAFGANGLGLQKLKATVSAQNFACIGLLERELGFNSCGCWLSDGLYNGEVTDTLAYELFKKDTVYGQEESEHGLQSVPDDAAVHTAAVHTAAVDAGLSELPAAAGDTAATGGSWFEGEQRFAAGPSDYSGQPGAVRKRTFKLRKRLQQ